MLDVRLRFAVWVALLLAARCLPAAEVPAEAPDEKESSQFLRLTRDKDDVPTSLETSIIRYAPVDGPRRTPTVDLVSAVHIADKSYYKQLDRKFRDYDAVLYELVTPEGSRAPKPDDPESRHPISVLQNAMKDVLALEFQLKEIDYARENMVHADMSPDQFAESMRQRGESMMTMLMRTLGYALTRQRESSSVAGDKQLLLALFDKNRALALKRILAEQFEDNEGYLAALEGPTGSTLISGRNKVALEVLRREIAAGKKKIAIFYGAAHMPDFEKRLRDEFKLAPVTTRWIVAWNLKQ